MECLGQIGAWSDPATSTPPRFRRRTELSNLCFQSAPAAVRPASILAWQLMYRWSRSDALSALARDEKQLPRLQLPRLQRQLGGTGLKKASFTDYGIRRQLPDAREIFAADAGVIA